MMLSAPIAIYERVALVSACLHIIDAGKEIPTDLRRELTEFELMLVNEYKQDLLSEIDLRR